MFNRREELGLANHFLWDRWPCPQNNSSAGERASVLGSSNLQQTTTRLPYEAEAQKYHLMIPPVPKDGVAIPSIDKHLEERDMTLTIMTLKTLKAEIARLTNILIVWHNKFMHAYGGNGFDLIHAISTSIRHVKFSEVLDMYQSLTHGRDITPYRWPLIMIARLFWTYTVFLTKEASLSDKLVKKIGNVDLPRIDQYGGRMIELDGYGMVEDADRRAPDEYHALAKRVEVWCTADAVCLSDRERSAWSALQLAVLALWEMRDG